MEPSVYKAQFKWKRKQINSRKDMPHDLKLSNKKGKTYSSGVALRENHDTQTRKVKVKKSQINPKLQFIGTCFFPNYQNL
jgi:hypothetical protein